MVLENRTKFAVETWETWETYLFFSVMRWNAVAGWERDSPSWTTWIVRFSRAILHQQADFWHHSLPFPGQNDQEKPSQFSGKKESSHLLGSFDSWFFLGLIDLFFFSHDWLGSIWINQFLRECSFQWSNQHEQLLLWRVDTNSSGSEHYPLVICYIAIENGPVEILSFPIHSMVVFPYFFGTVYQRVPITNR